jgi:hypothetical protein
MLRPLLLALFALLIAVLFTLRATDPAALAPLFARALWAAALALLEHTY